MVLPQIAQIYTEAANFRGCTCLRSALPLARARSAPTKQTVESPTDFTDLHRTACWGCSPTDCTDFTETLAEWSSHRFHRFTQMVRLRKIVAEVSLPPQQQSASHRLHRLTQNFLLRMFFHRLHGFTQMLLTSGGALVSSAPTEQYRYTSCYVGALETSAPPDISSEFCEICGRIFAPKQSVQICEICGRISPARVSVNFVKSVGESTHPNNLCRSVKSVGESTHPNNL